MIQKLHNEDPYARPNQNWIIQKELVGDEVIEIRKLTLRGKRRVVTVAITAFTIGTLLIVLNSPFRNSFLVPGELSSTHAQILAGQGADRCSACHPGDNQSLGSMLLGSFSSSEKSKCQSDLCMECHKNSINSEFALKPHNVEPSRLINEHSRFKQASFANLVGASPPINEENELACSTCHREHHGANDLKHMTDRQCQTCHSNVYHSFETDHPEFTNWPVDRRSRIAFDHVSHSNQHFPGKSAEFDCRQCHIDDSFANVQKLASFEVSCAGCHEQQIVNSGSQGLELFSLPMLDLKAIRSAKLDVGSWPVESTGDFDGQISPMMRLLLAGDSKAAKTLVQLGDGFDFSDVDAADVHQVKLASQLAWSIKYLLFDLSVKGEFAVRERLSQVLQRPVSSMEVNQLIHGASEATFQQASKAWFPKLNQEVATHRFVKPVGELTWLPTGDALMKVKPQDVQGADELAPNPLKALVQPDVRPLQQPDKNGSQPEPSIKVAWPSGLTPKTDNPRKDSNVVNKINEQEAGTDGLKPPDFNEWLAENPLKKQLNGEVTSHAVVGAASKAPPEAPDVYGVTPQVIANTTHFQSSRENSPTNVNTSAIPTNTNWIRDDLAFTISYRPSGHADSIVKAWSDLAGSIAMADVDLHAKPLFEEMTSMTGTGLCRSCHTVDRLADESFVFNWETKYRDPTIRSFTRFSHGPHLVLPNLADCRQCHQLNDRQSNRDSFVNFDSSQQSSNFNPLLKANCSNCHSKGRAENSCTQCHNYHVGSRVVGSNN